MTRKPLRLVQTNLGGINWGQDRCIKILQRACLRADVVLFCEATPITKDHAGLDPRVWGVLHDPTDQARAGSGIAYRLDRVTCPTAYMRLGVPAAYGIRSRWLWIARLVVDGQWGIKVVSGHAPPMRAWGINFVNWSAFMASCRIRNADVYGADWNRLSRPVGLALGRVTRMVGIVGFALRRALAPSAPVKFDVGSDHPAVQVVIS